MPLSARSTKFLMVLAPMAIAGLLLAFPPEDEPSRRAPVLTRVEVADVRLRDLHPHERVTGRLQPARSAELALEVAGRVLERHVEPGQPVETGQLLLVLDAGDREDALVEAEAQLSLEEAAVARDRVLLRLARDSLALAQSEVERLQRLGRESLSSKSQLDQSRRAALELQQEVEQLSSSVRSAEARVALRRAQRDQAERNLARTRLRAPFAGTVNAVHLEVGDQAVANRAAVELVDTAELDLYAQVRGEVASALTLGQSVTVDSGGRQTTGRVHALQVDPDPDTFTHALRIRVPGDGLQAGMTATVELPLRPLRGVAAVPVTAILREEGRDYVFQVEKDRLRRLPVSLGPRVGDWVGVLQGLEVGTRLVIRDVAALSEGQAVRVAGTDRAE